jgi:hypothetical protein
MEAVVDDLRYYPILRPKEMMETCKIRSQDSLSSGRYLNLEPADYEAVCYQLGRDIYRYIDGVEVWIWEGA